jgi:hypothetical protein
MYDVTKYCVYSSLPILLHTLLLTIAKWRSCTGKWFNHSEMRMTINQLHTLLLTIPKRRNRTDKRFNHSKMCMEINHLQYKDASVPSIYLICDQCNSFQIILSPIKNLQQTFKLIIDCCNLLHEQFLLPFSKLKRRS